MTLFKFLVCVRLVSKLLLLPLLLTVVATLGVSRRHLGDIYNLEVEYFALIISYCLATIDILLVGENRERSNAADASRSKSETILCIHSTQQATRESVDSLNATSRE